MIYNLNVLSDKLEFYKDTYDFQFELKTIPYLLNSSITNISECIL